MKKQLSIKMVKITFKGNIQELTYGYKPGREPTLVYLHGLGCAKDDFYEAAQFHLPGGPGLLAFDFPGCGASPLPAGRFYDIDDLVELTHVFLGEIKTGPFIIIGHSMGGLIGLLLAEKYPQHVCFFINVEGNLAGSDCFFSRHIASMDEEKFCGRLFKKYIGHLKVNSNFGLRYHAGILERYSDPRAMYAVAPSLVTYSDTGHLLDRFLKLSMPVQYIYGSENASLPYLKQLHEGGIPVAGIANSNHFPHQDNPMGFYAIVGKNLDGLFAKGG